MIKRIPILLLPLTILMLFSASLFAQSSRKSVSAAEVNGTFKMPFRGKYKDMSNELKILALGDGKIRIAFDLIYPYTLRNGEISVNMGGLDAEADIEGDTAVYSSDEYGKCTITIKFIRPGRLKVTQTGSDAGCGFGHNVSSAGTYTRSSSKKPTFDEESL